jgi:hypothetical protein
VVASTSSPDLWLVRTPENRIVGPFPKTEVCRLIQAGELGPQDEVCRADHYWFSLHETEECDAQLGVRPQAKKAKRGPPGSAGAEEEITETQTEVPEGEVAAAPGEFDDIPDLPTDAGGTQGTAVVRRAKRRSAAKSFGAQAPGGDPARLPLRASSASAAAPMKVSVRGISRVERPSIWKSAAWVLVLLAGLLVYSVLKVLKTGG